MPALHPSFAFVLAVALAPAPASASECRLKFRVNGVSGTLSESLSANQTRTLNRNGLIEALNDGRDDLVLTLENLNVTSSVVAMRQGNGQTLLVPPMPFTGQRLKSVLCRPHATLLDTGEALARVANPAHTVQQAAAAARQAVEQARDTALALYDPAQAQSQLSQMMQAMMAMQQMQMQQMQSSQPQPGDLSRGTAAPPVDLAAKFPELRRAIDESADLRAAVSAAAVDELRNRHAALVARLQELDRKYRVGPVATVVSGPALVAQHFPEIEALRRPSCTVEPPPLPHLDVQLRAFQSQLRTLLQQHPAGGPLPQEVRQRMIDVQEPMSSLSSRPWPLPEFHRVGSRFGYSFPHVKDTPTGLPNAPAPVPYPSLGPSLAPPGVAAAVAEVEEQLARGLPLTIEFLSRIVGLGGAAEAARADAQRVASHVAAVGADSADLGRALVALASVVNAHRSQLSAELAALGDAALAIDRLREGVRTGSAAMGACVAQLAANFVAAAQTAPQRLAAFSSSGTMQVQVPIPVRQALDATLERTLGLGPRIALLHQRVVPLPASHAAFDAARIQVLASALPQPRPELAQRVQALQQAHARWQSDLIGAQQAALALAQAHAQAVSAHAMLVQRLDAQAGTMKADVQSLPTIAFEPAPFGADLARVQALGPLWQQAAATLPQRLAALAAPAVPAPNPALQQGLDFVDTRLAAMRECHLKAVGFRDDLAQPQRVNGAVATATEGLLQQLTDLAATLRGLLTPTAATLARVPQALASAKQALQRVDGVGLAATQAFASATAPLRNGLQTNRQCFESQRAQAETRLAQLRSQLR